MDRMKENRVSKKYGATPVYGTFKFNTFKSTNNVNNSETSSISSLYWIIHDSIAQLNPLNTGFMGFDVGSPCDETNI